MPGPPYTAPLALSRTVLASHPRSSSRQSSSTEGRGSSAVLIAYTFPLALSSRTPFRDRLTRFSSQIRSHTHCHPRPSGRGSSAVLIAYAFPLALSSRTPFRDLLTRFSSQIRNLLLFSNHCLLPTAAPPPSHVLFLTPFSAHLTPKLTKFLQFSISFDMMPETCKMLTPPQLHFCAVVLALLLTA